MPKNSPSHTQNPEESAAILVKSDQNLIWLDCEMTGLDPDKERLIEIAIIVTGPNLEPRIEGPVLVIHQSDAHLDAMDKWNKSTHGKSGLIDKVKASTLTEADAETEILAFLKKYVPKGDSPMCGNTISQDRRFLVNYMPKLEAYFHYRTTPVTAKLGANTKSRNTTNKKMATTTIAIACTIDAENQTSPQTAVAEPDSADSLQPAPAGIEPR